MLFWYRKGNLKAGEYLGSVSRRFVSPRSLPHGKMINNGTPKTAGNRAYGYSHQKRSGILFGKVEVNPYKKDTNLDVAQSIWPLKDNTWNRMGFITRWCSRNLRSPSIEVIISLICDRLKLQFFKVKNDHRSKFPSNWKEEAWKKSGLQRDSNPWPGISKIDCKNLTNRSLVTSLTGLHDSGPSVRFSLFHSLALTSISLSKSPLLCEMRFAQ